MSGARTRRTAQPGWAKWVVNPWAIGLLLLVLWEASVRLFEIPLFLLPDLGSIAGALVDNRDILTRGLLTTGIEVVVSFLISILVGVGLGFIVVMSSLFRRTIFPLLVAGQAVPILAAAPLFIVWFGFGWTPKILMAVLITFFPIMTGTVQGLRALDPMVLDMARTLGLGRVQRMIKVQAPAALPAIFAGLRVASTLVIIGAVVGEFVGSSAGLGYVLLRATGTIDTPLLFAALLLLVGTGILLSWIVIVVERLAMPWLFES